MKLKINLDSLGIATSLLCAIHCAILPLVFTSLPFLGINFIHNEVIELLMIGLSIVIGYFALIKNYKSHHYSKYPIIIFSCGAILLVAKEFLHNKAYIFYILLILAVICIVTAHIVNFINCRKAKKCHTHEH
jgi:hypothetical protein